MLVVVWYACEPEFSLSYIYPMNWLPKSFFAVVYFIGPIYVLV